MLKLPKVKAAYMPERIFAEQKIPKFMVLDHLKKIYFGSLHSIVALDEEFLMEYLEPSFGIKLIEQLKQLKNDGYKLELYQDNKGIRGEPITAGKTHTHILPLLSCSSITISQQKRTLVTW